MNKTRTIRPLNLEDGEQWVLVIWEISPDQSITGGLDPRPPFQGATDYWDGDVWRMRQSDAKVFESENAAKAYMVENLGRMKTAPQP